MSRNRRRDGVGRRCRVPSRLGVRIAESRQLVIGSTIQSGTRVEFVNGFVIRSGTWTGLAVFVTHPGLTLYGTRTGLICGIRDGTRVEFTGLVPGSGGRRRRDGRSVKKLGRYVAVFVHKSLISLKYVADVHAPYQPGVEKQTWREANEVLTPSQSEKIKGFPSRAKTSVARRGVATLAKWTIHNVCPASGEGCSNGGRSPSINHVELFAGAV